MKDQQKPKERKPKVSKAQRAFWVLSSWLPISNGGNRTVIYRWRSRL